jgi:hypothetical protein
MAIEVYKILLQESPSYLHDLIKIKDSINIVLGTTTLQKFLLCEQQGMV